MSAHETVDGRMLRLARRESGGYWVRLAATGRTLGAIWRAGSRWHWRDSPTAFRGDGRPGHETDGGPTEVVPDVLRGSGSATRRRDVCEMLVEHLETNQAPVLGYGPHSLVRVGARLREVG